LVHLRQLEVTPLQLKDSPPAAFEIEKHIDGFRADSCTTSSNELK